MSAITFYFPFFFPVSNRCVELAACFANATDQHTGSKVSLSPEIATQFNCAPHEFDTVATMVFNDAESSIKYMFHASGKCGPSPAALAAYFPVYLLLTCLIYGIAVPSGLFVPGILSGAIYGRLVGLFFEILYPDAHHA